MKTRRQAIQALAAVPGAIVAQVSETKAKKTLVITAKGQKRLEEIFAEGGKITGVTISYSLPDKRPGWVTSGTAFLFSDKKEFKTE